MVPPPMLCRNHLLGEHRELHALIGIIRRGTKLDGYISNGLIDTTEILPRHEALAEEMTARGYRHRSPLTEQPACLPQGQVNSVENLLELHRRCAACKERIDKVRPSVGDRVRVVGQMDDPDPLPIGLEGTVTYVTPAGWLHQQYQVNWDGSRRTLMLLPHDPFVIL